jgi:signal recognition particle receptor subunit beta
LAARPTTSWRRIGRTPSFPIVLECNKADLPGATPPTDLAASLGLPESTVVRASAINGEGGFDALRAISKQVAARL